MDSEHNYDSSISSYRSTNSSLIDDSFDDDYSFYTIYEYEYEYLYYEQALKRTATLLLVYLFETYLKKIIEKRSKEPKDFISFQFFDEDLVIMKAKEKAKEYKIK